MYKIRTNTLKSIIQGQNLKPIIDQANKIKNANKCLKHFLSAPLSEHVIVSNIKGNTLILQTNSPAWSTRTNFIATEIVNYMRNEGGLAMVERLKVKVVPPETKSVRRIRSVEPLSNNSSKLLKSVASGIKNEALSAALQRLANRCTKPE